MNDYITLGILGISHKTAPVEIREEIAIPDKDQELVIKELKNNFDIFGCFIVSTCNRTEIYLSGESIKSKISSIKAWLDNYKESNHFSNNEVTYEKYGYDAVRHFFMVISSLDSQIIGEPQITGQVKESYNRAYQLKHTDSLINKLFNYSLQAEKKVRSNTFLSDGAVSVSFAGVELARKIFSDLKNKSVLLIGTGETAELAALHFQEKGVQKINITNRTFKKAEILANKFGGKAYKLSEIKEILLKTDIVISATASNEHIIVKEIMDTVCKIKNYQPIFLIDLAIPRDIDPKIEQIDGVYLYNLDDLNDIVQMNLEKRKQEIPKANKLIDSYVLQFQKWVATHSIGSIIKRLNTHFDDLRNKEMDRLKNRLPQENRQEIEYLTQSIANKLMHQHIKSLRKSVTDPDKYQQHLEFISELYELDIDK